MQQVPIEEVLERFRAKYAESSEELEIPEEVTQEDIPEIFSQDITNPAKEKSAPVVWGGNADGSFKRKGGKIPFLKIIVIQAAAAAVLTIAAIAAGIINPDAAQKILDLLQN